MNFKFVFDEIHTRGRRFDDLTTSEVYQLTVAYINDIKSDRQADALAELPHNSNIPELLTGLLNGSVTHQTFTNACINQTINYYHMDVEEAYEDASTIDYFYNDNDQSHDRNESIIKVGLTMQSLIA